MKFKLVSDKNRRINLNMDRINIYTSRWKSGTPFDFEIVRKVHTKSDPLRKYYFSVVTKTYMDDRGYERHEEELFHRQLKIVYFQIKPDEKGIYRDVPSVFGNDSDIPVPEKIKFVEWVVRCAAKDGVYIPDPNEGVEP